MLKITGAEAAKKKIPISPPLAVFVDPTDNLYPGNDNLLPFFFYKTGQRKEKSVCFLDREKNGVKESIVIKSIHPLFPFSQYTFLRESVCVCCWKLGFSLPPPTVQCVPEEMGVD